MRPNWLIRLLEYTAVAALLWDVLGVFAWFFADIEPKHSSASWSIIGVLMLIEIRLYVRALTGKVFSEDDDK